MQYTLTLEKQVTRVSAWPDASHCAITTAAVPTQITLVNTTPLAALQTWSYAPMFSSRLAATHLTASHLLAAGSAIVEQAPCSHSAKMLPHWWANQLAEPKVLVHVCTAHTTWHVPYGSLVSHPLQPELQR
jgi:hypothetical protein